MQLEGDAQEFQLLVGPLHGTCEPGLDAFRKPAYAVPEQSGPIPIRGPSIEGACPCRVLAMFARRPKLTGKIGTIAGKINHELFDFSYSAQAHGIPTIAGFPAVESIHGLYLNPPIHWLHLDPHPHDDLHFRSDLLSEDTKLLDGEGHKIQTLALNDISELVRDLSKPVSWADAMHLISELRNNDVQDKLLPWFTRLGGYKPVYFLVSGEPR